MASGKESSKPVTPLTAGLTLAAYVRQAANLTVEQAAKRARVCPAYLRQVERTGGAPYVLAVRLSRIYGCPLSVFLRFDLGKERPK